jgi:hypothetical protein
MRKASRAELDRGGYRSAIIISEYNTQTVKSHESSGNLSVRCRHSEMLHAAKLVGYPSGRAWLLRSVHS